MALSDIALVTVPQVKAYLRIDAVAALVIEAEYVGMGDGETTVFSLDHAVVEGSLRLYVNGELQVENTDFTLSDTTITFTTAPALDLPITASYDKVAADGTFEGFDTEVLEKIIEAATKKAETYTGRAFVQREITETRIGDGTQILKLYKLPVVSVSGVTINGEDFIGYSEKLSIGRIYHSTIWPRDSEIVVTYTTGYGVDRTATQALVPDVVSAVLLMLAYLYENRIDLVHAESISGLGSVTYELPLYVEKSAANLLLNPYRVGIL